MIQHAIPHLEIYLGEMNTCSYTKKSICMHLVALFLIAKTKTKAPRRGTTCSSTGEWINKSWYIHTMDCSSTIEGTTDRCNKLINFKHTMLSKWSHTQKAIYYMIPFIWNSGKGKVIGTENRSSVARGQGWQGLTAKGQHKGVFETTKLYHILVVVVVTWLYILCQNL